jgi:hypothetical protein
VEGYSACHQGHTKGFPCCLDVEGHPSTPDISDPGKPSNYFLNLVIIIYVIIYYVSYYYYYYYLLYYYLLVLLVLNDFTVRTQTFRTQTSGSWPKEPHHFMLLLFIVTKYFIMVLLCGSPRPPRYGKFPIILTPPAPPPHWQAAPGQWASSPCRAASSSPVPCSHFPNPKP